MPGLMSFPTRIVFGRGTAAQAPAELKRAGGRERALVLTDGGVLKANLLRLVAPALEQSGLKVTVWSEADAQVSEASAQAAASVLRSSGADCLVALGGGGVIDLAKAVRLLAGQEGELAGALARFGPGGDGELGAAAALLAPLVAIPTSAGAGSEANGEASLVARGATITLSSPKLTPDAALLDPELCLSLPPFQTAVSGFNALAHALEALVAKAEHPVADALALEGLRRLFPAIRAVLKNGRDLEAREQLLLGACLAGIAAQKGQGAARALAHALLPVAGTPRGLTCAVLLPAVLRFDRVAAEARLGQAAVALGFAAAAPPAEAAQAAAAMIEELGRACALPRKLSQVGVRREQLPEAVRLATASAAHAESPRACTEVDFERLLGEAM